MYLWIGCKLPEIFEREIRSLCLELNQAIGLDTGAFSLPQHVSLKISFEAEEYEAVLEEVAAFLAAQRPFTVRIGDPVQNGSILWLPVEACDTLLQMHNRLDSLLKDRFGIPQHEFDKAFLFHSTLFLDGNTEKITNMHRALESYPVARQLTLDTFLLGTSETGKAGSYHVVRQISV